MVEIVEASEEDRWKLADRMRPLRNGETPPWMVQGVEKGHYKITTVLHQGERIGCFWWWNSPGNKALVVNAAASFVKHDTYDCFMEAYKLLAKIIGAESISAQTRRPGIIRKYMRRGWTVEGVCLRKKLTE